MPAKSWVLQKPAVAGLLIRVGGRSWFWGRGTPSALKTSRPAREAERRTEAARGMAVPGKPWVLQKLAVAGLLIRVGRRSWFWGRGTPSALKASRPALEAEPRAAAATYKVDPRWSGVADWLRQMHAEAARLSPEATSEKERMDHGNDQM
jgi:hypothetical protein